MVIQGIKSSTQSGSALLSVIAFLGVLFVLAGVVATNSNNLFEDVKKLRESAYKKQLESYLLEAVDCNKTLPCAGGTKNLLRTDNSTIVIYKNSTTLVATCAAGSKVLSIDLGSGKQPATRTCP